MVLKLYLDNNVYNRPFDDRSVPRNRDEARIVEELLRRVSNGEVELCASFVLEFEHSRLPFSDRREKVAAFISLARGYVESSAGILERARELAEAGFGERDALHLAAAEHAGVDYFVTCDDRLIRRARRAGLAVRVVPPLELPEEGTV